jgi:hypothetical protein
MYGRGGKNMSSLAKFRTVMLFAMVKSAVLFWVVQEFVSDEWGIWKGALLAPLALGGLIAFFQLVNALFRTSTEDLWKSAWFRFMWVFWGGHWGGTRELRRVGTCKAFWLSLVGAGYVILLVSVVVFVSFLVLMCGAGIWMFGNPNSSINVSIAMLLISMVLFIFSFGTALTRMEKEFGEGTSTLFLKCAGGLLLVLLAVLGIPAPIQAYGFLTYGTTVGASILALAILAGIVGSFIFVSRKIGGVAQSTIGGILVSSWWQGWKEKTCIIIEEPHKQDDHSS